MRRRIILIVLVPVLALVVLAAAINAYLQAAQVNPVDIIESVIGPSRATAFLDRALGIALLPLNLIIIGLAFLAALVVSRLSYRIAGRLLDAASIAKYSDPKGQTIPEAVGGDPSRRLTLQQLLASLIGFTAFTTASVFALSQFVSLTNLAILATVLANAFGFAARDYVGDILNGLSNLFEDRFDIGDNVEIVTLEDELRGIVEEVNVRTLGLRTRNGELLIVPQGQVRILRNFTRGAFTGTDVTVSVPAADLLAAMQVLVDLGQQAPAILPDLLEPWRVISREGQVNSVSQLVIYAKSTYGRGSQLRLEIMALVQERLEQAGIALSS